MKKSWFIFLAFIFLFNFASVSATISNVQTEPLHPNLDSSLIKIYAEVSNASQATLYYRINDITYSSYFSISKGASSFIYEDISDNLKVFYWIEAINNGEKETTGEFSFTYDGSPPAIGILGENPMIVIINSSYDELWATAIDNVYGDLTPNVSISGVVDTNVLGEYEITYSVSDLAGNAATAERLVRVIEQPVATSGSAGGGNSYSASGSGGSAAANSTTGNSESENQEEQLQNSDTSPRASITGKSFVDIIGENKGISIFIGILIIGTVVGYYLIKKEVKRKLYGK